jgi:dipeptidyl aminopeptidase/acylaminoacyl peptidase
VKRLVLALAVALALATRAAVSTAAGPPSVESVLSALQSVQDYDAAQISPDGTRVAWVRKIRNSAGAWKLAAVHVTDLPGHARARRVTADASGSDHDERGPVWSPDSSQIAFLSDAEKAGQMQVWVTPAAGGPVRRLTTVSGQLSDLRWSPDGRSIAFLFVEGSAQETGALTAYKPDAGVVEEKIEEQRIAVVDAGGGRVRSVSPANLYVYEYDWSPDGKRFAAEAAEGSGTNNYWIAQLYTVDAQRGETRSVWKPPLQIACPRWSPAGDEIAVIHGIMSDQGSTGGDIWTVPLAAAGSPRNRTDGMKASASELFWRSPGEILFTEYVDGDEGVAALDAAGKVRTLWHGPAVLKKFSVARRGSASAAIRSSFSQPPEIVAGPIGTWAPVTSENAAIHPFWGEARNLTWQSDGQPVQGWLLSPIDSDPAKKSPMVVVVHGGPSSAATAGWPQRWTAILPSQDYFVFLPNPRGSFGQGEAFTRGNVKDFGYGDFRDIERGVDAALASAPIDPKRLGICGWSYGGYMTMWAVTQTNRYAAAVAGAGIVSWQSYYGQNRIDQWLLPFFGASVYDDPDVYARSSPITFIKKARTPTLVLHGDRDSEVPTPQGYEFWHALKTLGVPTTLVIFENEGHAIQDPKHQLDRDRRLVEWFDRYFKSGGSP